MSTQKNNRNPIGNGNLRFSTLPCLICKKQLASAVPGSDINQPHDGLACTTHGHFGSRAFDPMNGRFLEFNICDSCLKKAAAQNLIALGLEQTPLRVWVPEMEYESDN